jgi:CRP/FNR family cyclic AMP-dependent transcriptional regulator
MTASPIPDQTPGLRKAAILAGVDDAAVSFLAQRAVCERAPVGTVVVREGEPGNRFFLLTEGSVRICKQFGNPHEVELVQLNAGDFFGEMCILETLPRCATVQAVTDIAYCTLGSLVFYHLYEKMPAQYGILLLNIARDLSRRLRRADEAFASRH